MHKRRGIIPLRLFTLIPPCLSRHDIHIVIIISMRMHRIIAQHDVITTNLCITTPISKHITNPTRPLAMTPPKEIIALHALSTLALNHTPIHMHLLFTLGFFHFGLIETNAKIEIVHLIEVHCLASHNQTLRCIEFFPNILYHTICFMSTVLV